MTTFDYKPVPYPALNIDKVLGATGTRGRVERFLMWNLMVYLEAHGWTPYALNDTEELIKLHSKEYTMEHVFNLDMCNVWFAKDKFRHRVLIILGNDGTDLCSDWTFTDGDPDNFYRLMDDFTENAEKMAHEAMSLGG